MSKEIKEIENKPGKAVYQFGEGKNALTLSIQTGNTTYDSYYLDSNYYSHKECKPTDFISLNLSSNGVTLMSIISKTRSDDILYPGIQGTNCGWDAVDSIAHGKISDKKINLAEMLYNDNSKSAIAVKKFLAQINGNQLVDELKKLMKETSHRRDAELQRQKEEQLKKEQEEQARKLAAEQKRLKKEQDKQNASDALDKFVGADENDIEEKKEKILENKKKTKVDSKLSTLRKKIAHDVDETLGTKLEEKKLPKPLKKIEKAVSDKLFGEVKE